MDVSKLIGSLAATRNKKCTSPETTGEIAQLCSTIYGEDGTKAIGRCVQKSIKVCEAEKRGKGAVAKPVIKFTPIFKEEPEIVTREDFMKIAEMVVDARKFRGRKEFLWICEMVLYAMVEKNPLLIKIPSYACYPLQCVGGTRKASYIESMSMLLAVLEDTADAYIAGYRVADDDAKFAAVAAAIVRITSLQAEGGTDPYAVGRNFRPRKPGLGNFFDQDS